MCAAFDHRESRSGDPDLHTHVAVANKVRGVDGKWRSLDARGLHALGVAASERYNTRIEDGLARRLGVSFVERPGRPGGDTTKRPVREVVGIPHALVRHFSKRRAAIEDRYTDLARDYRHAHGREPDRPTQLKLAQQATLETRDGKGIPRTLAELVADWTAEASTVLGRGGIERMLAATLGRSPTAAPPSQDELVRAGAAGGAHRLRAALHLDPLEPVRRDRTRPAPLPVPHPYGPGRRDRGGGRACDRTGTVDPDQRTGAGHRTRRAASWQ